MGNTIIKNAFKEVRLSFSRFLAILLVIMIGSAFYTGLKSVGPDLEASADRYFEATHFMDFRLLSSIGFNDADLAAVRNSSGVEDAQPIYTIDAFLSYGQQTNVAHVISIPDSTVAINDLHLVEGRFPQQSDECVVDKQRSEAGPKIGDTITLSSGTETPLSESLSETVYHVVGLAESPSYLTKDRGTAKLGTGKINSLVFLPAANFTLPAYTEILVTAAGTSGISTFSEEYIEITTPLEESLNTVASQRVEIRQQELKADAEAQLAAQKTAFAAANGIADPSLLDSSPEFLEAQKSINELAAPQWHVLNRESNSGYLDYQNTIESTNGIASILPLFFFGIATLVCLTTMTRMVEEQRTQIGTLKALGYSNAAIAFKYLLYAATASVLGSLLGWAIGFMLIPQVIFNAYRVLYTLPEMTPAFHVSIASLSALFAISVTTVATFLSCLTILRSAPAELMLPSAPPPGKRIFLENVDFIWKKLQFSQKITFRNLFRYKKRFWMTVLGVACCTAMLVAGLGLRDSIATQVAEKQFGDIMRYDVSLQLKENLTMEQKSALVTTLANTNLSTYLDNTVNNISVQGSTDNSDPIDSLLMVPADPAALSNYFMLRSYDTGEPLVLSDHGVILTQKLAKNLDVTTGDTIVIKEDETTTQLVLVEGIAENYLQHYVFLSPSYYQTIYGELPQPNQVLGLLDSTLSQEDLAATLMATAGVSAVRFTSDNEQDFQNTLGSINYLIWIIIIAAALLALVVQYTLTTINISERFREIATIKVLGLYDREVSAYITRESYLLTLFGILPGLIGGIFLHGYILDAAEVGNVMYVESILAQSFILSILLTFMFTWLVNLIMIGTLKKINMVEALKSNE
ncbi:FtsX-like permease family protein [Acetobacterium sp. UBA5834]|jgi:putative ABC transport system permease protein|uniref:ABC transporter permease n=1 Tax=Acetobacterium sp. UBA5834 TaxID=1945907 RepID=UPI00257D8F32|nr:FtsX-like permease family protein [Acetobacterium sp. UBA5834]